MIDFLKKNINNISPPVYKNMLLYYEWNNNAFYEKQYIRKVILEDYKELLKTTKLVDTSFIERLIALYKKDISFYDYLFQISRQGTSNFFNTYNMFKCFSCKMLIHEEVLTYMKSLLFKDELISEIDKEKIYNYLDSIYLNYGKKKRKHKNKCTFAISEKDIECFVIDRKSLNDKLKGLREFYQYEIQESIGNILIEFDRSRRHLPMLSLIKVKSRVNESSISLRNIGFFKKN